MLLMSTISNINYDTKGITTCINAKFYNHAVQGYFSILECSTENSEVTYMVIPAAILVHI